MNTTESPPKRRRPYRKSGVYALKAVVRGLDSRTLLSKRHALGRALIEWRASLVTDLGGEANLSVQQLTIIDMVMRTKLMLDSVDNYLLGLPSIVDKRHRRLWPVAKERQILAGQLQGLLRDLGLTRKEPPTEDLGAYLARRQHEIETEKAAKAEATPTELAKPMPTTAPARA